MKKKFSIYAYLLLVCAVGMGCSSSIPTDVTPEIPPEEKPETPPDEEDVPVKVVESVYMEGEDVLFSDANTRTNLTMGDNKLKFSWAEDDQVGVVPMDGSQIFFKVKAGAGTKYAQFDGGSWALKANTTYAAYFPYRKENTDKSKAEIRFSYVGQKQTGDASLAHMGAYDLMAANPVSSVDDKVLFKFKHMNCICIFRLKLPAADSYTSFTLRSNKPIIAKTANLDFSNSEVVPSFIDLGHELKMDLADIATTDTKKEIVLYMMLPAINFSTENVTVVLHSKKNKTYQGVLARKHIQSGHAYSFVTTMRDVTVSSNVDSPSFGENDVEI